MTDEPEDVAKAAAAEEALWNEEAAKRASGQKEADEPKAGETAETDEGNAPPEPAPEDIWANAPDPLKTAYRDLEARFEAQRKQLGGETRKIKDLQKQLRGEKPVEKPAKIDPKELDDAMGGLEDYPDIKAALSPIAEAVKRTNDRIDYTEAATEAVTVGRIEEQEAALEAAHPGWLAFLQANSEKFSAFVEDDDQPAWVRRTFEANEKHVVDATAAGRMVARFKEYVGTIPPQSQAAAAADPTPASDRRNRQLAALSSPPPKNPGVRPDASAGSEDLETEWQRELERRRRARA